MSKHLSGDSAVRKKVNKDPVRQVKATVDVEDANLGRETSDVEHGPDLETNHTGDLLQ